jgi:hypothetical protein
MKLPFDAIGAKKIFNKAKRTLLRPVVLANLLETKTVLYGNLPSVQVDLSLGDLCRAYPQRIQKLFEHLDLNRQGLEPVQAAATRRDWVAACEALVSYYQNHETPRKLGARLNRRDSAVAYMSPQQIIADTYTFQGHTGTVPRYPDGRLTWNYQGPKQDQEWAWFFNRHYHLLNLLLAYRKTGNPADLSCLNQQLLDWITASFSRPSQWGAQWRGREVAMRMLHWTFLFYGLSSAAELSPTVRILMLSSILDHACYLRHLHHWGGNWLCREMNGLATIALCWSEFKLAPQWLSYASDHLLQELDNQFYPDGVHKELTSHYHRVVFHDLQNVADLLALTGNSVPAVLNRRLEKMLNYLAYTMSPDGRGLLNNDSDQDYNRTLIQTAAAVYDRSDWAYIASSGKAGQKPKAAPSTGFPWAGQVICRSGWDDQAHWSFFDIGPLGTNYHIHYDKLHLSVAAWGRHLLVDSGRYHYIQDRVRQYFCGSASHNVILIDGKEQGADRAEGVQPMTENYTIAPAFDFAWGTFDGKFRRLKGKAVHTRAIVYLRDQYWVVVDQIETDRPRRIEPLWHFHPDCTVAQEGDSVVSTDPEVGNLRIVPAATMPWQVKLVAGQADPIQGWWSREYNHCIPNSTAIYSTSIAGSTTFAWVLYPARGKVPPVKVKLLPAPQGSIRMTVAVAGREPDEIAVCLSSEDLIELSNDWTLKGKCAILQAGKQPLVAQGSLFHPNGKILAESSFDAPVPTAGGRE